MTAVRQFPARLDALDEMLSFIKDAAGEDGGMGDRITDLMLAAEEAFTNVAKHADVGRGTVEVKVERSPRAVSVTLQDRGRPFDPSAVPPPNLDASIEDRPVGGLGIHLIYRLTDEVRYRREGEANILTLTVRMEGERAEKE